MSASVEIPPHTLAGERLAVGGARPFLLEADDVWLVAAGSVDVFAVRLDERRPVGPRMHLVRVVEGRAMFGRARTAGDRRSQIVGGGDPGGSADGAGGEAPRGID